MKRYKALCISVTYFNLLSSFESEEKNPLRDISIRQNYESLIGEMNLRLGVSRRRSCTPCKCRRDGPQLQLQNYYNSVVLAWNLGTFCQARNASLTICSARTLEKGWGVHSHHVSVGGAVLAP